MRRVTSSAFYRAIIAQLKVKGNDTPANRKEIREGLLLCLEAGSGSCKRDVERVLFEKNLRGTPLEEMPESAHTELLNYALHWDGAPQGHAHWKRLSRLLGCSI